MAEFTFSGTIPKPQVLKHLVIMEPGIELMLFLYSPQSRKNRTCPSPTGWGAESFRRGTLNGLIPLFI